MNLLFAAGVAEMLGAGCAAMVALALLGLAVRLLGFLFGKGLDKALGRDKPLAPKDGGKDTPERGELTEPQSPPSEELLGRLAARTCPLHNLPFVGLALIDVEAPEISLNYSGPTPKGRLQIAVCTHCAAVAVELKEKRFEWFHANHAEHPEWASSHIVPHLFGSRSARIHAVLMKVAGVNEWTECSTQNLGARSQGNPAAHAPSREQDPAADDGRIAKCECGKKFRVKGGLKGNRIKCPGCGKAITIP